LRALIWLRLFLFMCARKSIDFLGYWCGGDGGEEKNTHVFWKFYSE
jgi:hypothetical protein